MQIIYTKISELKRYENNARTHSKEQIVEIANGIKSFGFLDPIEIDQNNTIISGHARLEAALNLGLDEVPTIIHEHLTPAQRKAYTLAANKLALKSGWDLGLLKDEFGALKNEWVDLKLTGFSEDEINALLGDDELANTSLSGEKTKLTDKFLVPPFTVLDARQGYWQERKKQWLAMGIKSELGRGDDAIGYGKDIKDFDFYRKKNKYGKCLETGIGDAYGRKEMSGTSIFDPVLCELAYRWFSPPEAVVLDPFAGGSVRGITAAICGRHYVGIDLRAEQIEANRQQLDDLNLDDHIPVWHQGDSHYIAHICAGIEADFIFTCPPYGDLEVYSDDPNDISNMQHKEFMQAFQDIIFNTCSLLKENRFACIVVGDYRDKNGIYSNFVSLTIEAFQLAGLKLYNEAVLITVAGTLPVRITKQFNAGRKLGKTHQNVLVFVKGCPKEATKICGQIDIPEIEPDISQDYNADE